MCALSSRLLPPAFLWAKLSSSFTESWATGIDSVRRWKHAASLASTCLHDFKFRKVGGKGRKGGVTHQSIIRFACCRFTLGFSCPLCFFVTIRYYLCSWLHVFLSRRCSRNTKAGDTIRVHYLEAKPSGDKADGVKWSASLHWICGVLQHMLCFQFLASFEL